MLVYHGSDVVVGNPKILVSARTLDFGAGFYTTTNRTQATDFAFKVMRRNGTNAQNVSVYKFDLDRAKDALSILEFVTANEEWLDFVSANRMGKPQSGQYDIVIGAVANDTVYRVFGLYESGLIDKETALKQLKIQKLYNQVVFRTENALRYLTYKYTLDKGDMANE